MKKYRFLLLIQKKFSILSEYVCKMKYTVEGLRDKM